MLRAILIFCLLALGAPAWADGAPCPDKQYVLELMAIKQPTAKHMLFTGIDGQSIKAAINGAAATEFLVFVKPDSDSRLVVGFRDGCMEGFKVIDRATLDRWLAGQEAGQ